MAFKAVKKAEMKSAREKQSSSVSESKANGVSEPSSILLPFKTKSFSSESVEQSSMIQSVIDSNSYESMDESIVELAVRINTKLLKEGFRVTVDQKKIEDILSRTWWTSHNRQIHTISDENHVLFNQDDRDIVFDDANDGIINLEAFEYEAEALSTKDNKVDLVNKARLMRIPNDEMVRYIKLKQQRNELFMKVDMFAEKTEVKLTEEGATITYKHLDFPYDESKVIESVVSDYKKHFPFIDEMIDSIVSFRFASCRKHGYLWLHADSDFGKGFFENRLKALGLIVEMNANELKAIMDRKPCGKSITDFRRSFVLFFNEFNKINGSMKSIENEITINPKNQSEVRVEVFSKIFCSAESVRSLVTDIGVEDQYANRFSYHRASGSIKPLISKYREQGIEIDESITNYIAGRLNERVAYYKAMGREKATNQANIDSEAFYSRNKIANNYELISSNVDDIAQNLKSFVADVYTGRLRDDWCIKGFIHKHKDNPKMVYVTSNQKVLSAFVKSRYDGVEATQIGFKKNQILDAYRVESKNTTIKGIINTKTRIDFVELEEFDLDRDY